ncbi:MAG: cytochrome c biogenesis protein CcdA [Deltaproteobacteria bacterium]|nr:cytochrome c biogenesis protein CcdA [Deltaproteobacteria bacterium]
MGLSETLGQVLQTRPVLAYGASYLGGVIATASPCILASIPLVIGFVGGYAGGQKQKAFLYSLTFVVGLAVVMSALGAAAALMGTMFGDVGIYWYFVVAVILMVMGLQLAGILKLKLGGDAQRFLPKQTGLLGALILGMLFGLVLSPCASPVLAVILTLAAVQGHVAYGTTLLFSYALGQGTLILLAGTFTGVINNFLQSRGAKAGQVVQQVAGGLIFFAGAYIFFQGVRGW